jgi:phage tail-like protein
MALYPLPKFSFLVEWGGAKIGFTEVTGLIRQTEAIEYRDGASREYKKTKQPGLEKVDNLTLKRGTFQGDTDFYDWFNTIQMNTAQRRDVVIKLLNENFEPVMTWRAVNGFVAKYQASDLKSDGNEVAIEMIEIAHEGLSMVK